MLILVVEDQDGAVGIGECWIGGGQAGALLEFLRNEVAPGLVGAATAPAAVSNRLLTRAAPSARSDLWHAAASGVDIALWDLAARRCGLPLYRLLGGGDAKVPVYASGGMYGGDPEAIAREAHEALAWAGGYKMKAGGAPVQDDLVRARAVRDAIPQARLMVDFMFVPDRLDAVRRLHSLADLGLHFAETPTALEDVEGWSDIHRMTGIPLSGPEIGVGLDLHRRYLAAGAVQVLQFDLSVCGGVTEGMALAALSRAHFRPFALHCAGSAIVFAASAHLAAAAPLVDSVERHLLHDDLFDRLESGGYRFADGFVTIPETPGLGIEILPNEMREAAWLCEA
jgi:D-galactarolactone cycloisomerase